jgi:hypothetical protein
LNFDFSSENPQKNEQSKEKSNNLLLGLWFTQLFVLVPEIVDINIFPTLFWFIHEIQQKPGCQKQANSNRKCKNKPTAKRNFGHFRKNN